MMMMYRFGFDRLSLRFIPDEVIFTPSEQKIDQSRIQEMAKKTGI
jgi:hypothetical protein